MNDLQAWLQNRKGNDEIRGEDDVLVPVDTQAMWVELLSENVKGAGDIFWPLVDDIEVGICLYQTTWGGSKGSCNCLVFE